MGVTNRIHSTRPRSRLYSDIPRPDAPVIYTGAFPILTARPGQRSIYNNCTTKPLSWKTCVNIHCKEKSLWSWSIWQNYCQESTVEDAKNTERFQSAKVHKYWTIEQWNKVFWTDEVLNHIMKVFVRWRVGERAATPYITPTVNRKRGTVMVCGGRLLPMCTR